ncbi:MAG: PEP-CTERM sorting domain-containing protein [Pirellulales bacterium]|nr:PEP-CTERM sorting domain-containing protein [Pirellulales bacterium]
MICSRRSIVYLCILIVCFGIVRQTWADEVDPYLEDISRTPGAVDVSASAQSITVELQAIDTLIDGLSGIDNGGIMYYSPSGTESAGFGFTPEWNLISGNKYDGVYSFPVTFDQYAEAGDWLPRVDLRDEGGNSVLYSHSDLVTMGFTNLAVTVTSITPDVTPPVLVDATRNLNMVDTTSGSQSIQVTTHVTDDLSGLDFGGVTWRSPSGTQSAGFGFYPEWNLVSGDANDGHYAFPVEFKQYCEPGVWEPVVDLQDEIGNSEFYSTAQLDAMGLTDLEVQVISTPDVTAPVIVELDRDPQRVITTNSEKTIQVSVRVTDDMSGLDNGGVVWRSPSGIEIAGFGFSLGNLVSGDANDGIYEFPVTFQQGCEKGTWLPVVDLEDDIGNDVFYSNSDLINLGLNMTVEVGALAGDANEDGYVDVSDLGILATHYGTTSGAEWGDADFNGDGKVDVSDLGALAANYGAVPTVAVPEPSALAGLLGMFLMGLLGGARRKRC